MFSSGSAWTETPDPGKANLILSRPKKAAYQNIDIKNPSVATRSNRRRSGAKFKHRLPQAR
jgi:hypothetical protein